MKRFLVCWGLLSACASTPVMPDKPADVETPAADDARSEVSRENANPPKYPAIVECALAHSEQDWSEQAFHDVAVSIDFTEVPLEVDFAPDDGFDRTAFEFCVRESIRQGDVPFKASSMLATGFRLYERGDATSIPMVQGGIDRDTFRRAFAPGLNVKPNPYQALNGCLARYGEHPFAGVVLLGARIVEQKATDVEIVASTLRQPRVEECMVERMKAAEIPLEGGPFVIRYPMSFRTL